jgi:hypothetical protein
MTTKVCKKCQVEKCIDEFSVRRASCKPCERERHRIWHAANYEEKLKDKKALYKKTNKNAINAYMRKKYADDPNFRMKAKLRVNMRRVMLCMRLHDIDPSARVYTDLLGCTLDEFREHIEKQFIEGMTWQNEGMWEYDHIRPLASFDLSDPEQVRESSHYTNFQPLWASDNRRKSSKLG